MTRRVFSFLFCLVLCLPPVFAQGVVKMLDGQVKRVDLDSKKLILSYENPVDRQRKISVFSVDEQTGFSEGIQLQDLKENDPVSVDYEEVNGSNRAILVKRVPIRGIPKEIHR